MMSKWMALFGAVLVLGAGWIWFTRVPLTAQADRLNPEPAIGYLAPDFALITLDGAEFRLSEVRGTPVVLNFWATWCGPCRRELPALQAAAERYADEVLIVGVDQGEEAATVQGFVDDLGLTFPIPMDRELAVAGEYNVKGLPTTFFVDSHGVIRHVWAGEMNSVTLAEGISKIWP
jgi:cytochrome c biogenesis protein CcmG, thiol:disulfide interchange protein DsbE